MYLDSRCIEAPVHRVHFFLSTADDKVIYLMELMM